jgi:translation initiation factor 5B
MIRKVLVTVIGHVDHGKSSVLDFIRGSSIVEKEAGFITQAIGASIIPIQTIQRVCGGLLDQLKLDITIPGFLAIDTPGHAAFTSLRKRGGNLADIAILVVDINEGFMPQTEEAIDIIVKSKTPFVIAANKIDLLPGWKKIEGSLIQGIMGLPPAAQTALDKKIYELVGSLHEKFKMNSERFDRVDDYTKTVAIIPTSAKTGEGIPELLMVLTGLAQRFFAEKLETDVTGPARGTVLEIKEEKGLGKTMDVIIYDGRLAVNDTIVIGGINEPIVTKVKALFEPAELEEMRYKKTKFRSVKEVIASTGVKISAKEIEEVVAGVPIAVATDNDLEEVKQKLQEEVEQVIIETEKQGIVIKADSLGSLEAMIVLLKEKNISIRKAMVGDITKKDMLDAESNYENDPLKSVILGFNVILPEELKSEKVKVILSDIIYKIIEGYEKWQIDYQKSLEMKNLKGLARPFKVEIMKGYIFRQSNPAVVGVDILDGTVRTGVQVMKKDGQPIAEVKSVQAEQKTIPEAEKGKQVAISLPGLTVGRQIKEGEILYSYIPEDDFKKLKEFKQYLSNEEKALLKEIVAIMREKNPVWGI